ncbi:Gmad2 immunoglobulin-like domain-containing protein [Nocardioides sp.]|uniref:Gmad2 immunoglobulin-like domain-containing protein n=1 Tax=Nocardioides sp. TaxID=35761 RepID=UPI00356405A2
MTRLPQPLAANRAVLAAAALLLSAGLAGCGDQQPTSAEPTSSQSSPTPEDSASVPTSQAPAPAEKVTVPVYFVGETPQGQALFREFRKVEADNPMEEAVALMVAGDALDPDYGTLWPSGSFESVAFSSGAGAIVASVSDDTWADAPGGMNKAMAKLALQQLVYTVQGIQQERLPVLVQEGSDPATLFGVDTTGGLEAADQLDVLGLVNVTNPEEGASVSGTFIARGVASSFEATVPWQIRDASGKTVLEGFSTAEGWLDKLYPWETEIDVSSLSPGSYTFVAMTDDPSGGEGGGPTEDSKTIVVS